MKAGLERVTWQKKRTRSWEGRIPQSTEKTCEITTRAVEQSEAATAQMAILGESASEINRQVREIQDATSRSTKEMDAITGIFKQANTRVGGIARAVEEQSVATNEVAKNINEASAGFYSANQMMEENDEGLKQVAHDICQLEETAKGVESGAAQVDQNAATLLTLAREMVRMVDSSV